MGDGFEEFGLEPRWSTQLGPATPRIGNEGKHVDDLGTLSSLDPLPTHQQPINEP